MFWEWVASRVRRVESRRAAAARVRRAVELLEYEWGPEVEVVVPYGVPKEFRVEHARLLPRLGGQVRDELRRVSDG